MMDDQRARIIPQYEVFYHRMKVLVNNRLCQHRLRQYYYRRQRIMDHLEHSCNRSGFFLTGTGRKGQTGPAGLPA